MTQQEKLQLQAAKRLYKTSNADQRYILESLFPELRESEDERIRKSLAAYFAKFKQSDMWDNDFSFGDILAWLEKQVQKPTDAEMKEILRTEYEKGRADGMLYQAKKEIEKQGEQKPIISNDAIREGIAHFGITQYQIDNWLKKYVDVESQGEQKSADKVEPKFKVGDWIINTESGYIRQILKINNGCYETDYGVLPIKDYESIFRLWTMQNAKEGDVLALSYASKNYVLIYKGLYEKSFKTIMSVFCFYCVEEDTYYDETDSFHVMNRGEIITPATKEQRDTLFAKMKEAGYEWSSEHRKLIKIVK